MKPPLLHQHVVRKGALESGGAQLPVQPCHFLAVVPETSEFSAAQFLS